MTRALRQLLEDSGLRVKTAQASKELGRQFSVEEMARRVVQIYGELLA